MKKYIILIFLFATQLARAEVVCESKGSFATWLQEFKKEAVQKGISPTAIQLAAPFLTFDPSIIKRDRNQSVFQQTFLQFSDRMASDGRRKKGIQLLATTHKDLFEKVERDFGVPAQPILSFWALESDFGAVTGKFSILSAITTLAFDCRRSEMFRKQAFDALRLVQRGDLKPQEMIGNWAGELGGTQFMASDYFESGIDYDQDQRVDLTRSIPDTIASAGNFLAKKGWRRGEPWMEEVKVPASMAWEEADIQIKHPVSRWNQLGVKPMKGAFKDQNLMASLLLPMGRLGPAFLVYPNFHAFLGWNESMVYSTTAAYLALRMTGAPAMQRGSDLIKHLGIEEVKEIQTILIKRGYTLGEVDGKAGPATKAAVKAAQLKLGLPADSYPTLDVLEALRK